MKPPRRRWRWLACGCLLAWPWVALFVVSLLPEGPQHILVREALLRAVSAETGREVSLGPLSGNLWRGVCAERFVLAGPGGLGRARGNVQVSIDRLELRWRLSAMLWRADPLAGIALVRLDRPQVLATRRADGRLDLQDLVKPRPRKGKSRFRGHLRLTDGLVVLLDEHTRDAAGKPIRSDLRDLDIDVRFSRYARAKVRAQVRVPRKVGQAGVAGELRLEPRTSFRGTLDLADLRLEAAAPYVNPHIARTARLDRGLLSMSGPFNFALPLPGTRDPVQAGGELTARFTDAAFHLWFAQRSLSEVNGRVGVRLSSLDLRRNTEHDGWRFDHLRLRSGHSSLAVDGFVRGWQPPTCDLRVRSDQLFGGDVAHVLKVLRFLGPLRSEGTSRLDLRVRGKLPDWRVDGWLEPGGLGWADLVRYDRGRLTMDLRKAAAGQGVAGARGWVELRGVDGRTRFLTQPFSGADGRVALDADAVALTRFTTRIGGVPVFLDGRVAQPRPQAAQLDLVVRTTGLAPLALARLVPAPWTPRAAQGGLSVDVRLKGPLRGPAAVGRVHLPRIETSRLTVLGGDASFDLRLGAQPAGWLQLGGAGVLVARLAAPVTDVAGRVEVAGGELALSGVRARYAGEPVALAGSVTRDGQRFNLRVQTPGLDVGRLATALRGRPLVARAGGELRLSGTREAFTVAGALRVPHARTSAADGGWEVRGGELAADLSVQPARRLAGLLGHLALRNLQVTGKALPAALRADSARLRFTGPRLEIVKLSGAVNGDPLSVSGAVADLPRRRGLDLSVLVDNWRDETLRKLASAAPVRLEQPLSASLRVRGAWPTPAVSGAVLLPGLLLTGEQPLRLAGRAEVDLRLAPPQPKGKAPPPTAPKLPATGTVRLVDVSVVPEQEDLAARRVCGMVRLMPDDRVIVVSEATGSGVGQLRGWLGDSELAVEGSVLLAGKEPTADLLLSAGAVHVADLRAALLGLGLPRVEGEGALALGGLRVSGPPKSLRLTSEPGPEGDVQLPPRLVWGDWRFAGGRARLDLTLAGSKPASGTVEVRQGRIQGAVTGSSVELSDATLRLADGRLERADLQATSAGGGLRVAAKGLAPANGGGPRYGARVEARSLVLADLLPEWRGELARLPGARVSSELTLVGPPDDVGVTGRVRLACAGDGDPLLADVRARVVQTGTGKEAQREVLGGVTLSGGDLVLADLGQPLHDVHGEVKLVAGGLEFDVRAKLPAGPVTLKGSLCGRPQPAFDVVVGLAGVDLARCLEQLPLPADAPAGKRDMFDLWGLPRLRTPEPARGTVHLQGAGHAALVALDVTLPLVVPAPELAVSDPRGLGVEDGAAILARNLRLGGRLVGSFGRAPAAPKVAAAAVTRLVDTGFWPAAGVVLAAQDQPPAAQTALMDRFRCDLRVTTDGLRPRQTLALLPAPQRRKLLEGPLGEVDAFAPARVSAQASGPLRKPTVNAQLELPRLAVRGVPLRRVAANVEWTGDLLTIHDAEAELRGGSARAAGALRLGADEPLDLQARVVLRHCELAAATALKLTTTPLGGVLDGELAVHRLGDVTKATGVASLAALAVHDQELGSGSVGFALDGQRLNIQRLLLHDPRSGAFARLRGSVGLEGDGALDLAGEVRSFDLDRLAPLLGPRRREALSGRLDFAGSVGGTRKLPMVTGVGNVFFGSLAGMPFNRLTLRATPTAKDAVALRLELSDPAYQAAADVALTAVDLRSGQADYRLAAELKRVDLAQTAPLLGYRALGETSGGTLVGSAQLSGRLARDREKVNPLADLRGTVVLDAHDDRALGRARLAGITLDAAHLKLTADGQEVRLDELALATGKTRLALDPAQPSRLRGLNTSPRLDLHLESPRLTYDDLAPALGVALPTSGHLSAKATITGEPADPSASLVLATHDFTVCGERLPDRQVAVRLTRGALAVEQTETFDLFGAHLSVKGGRFKDRVQSVADVEIDDLPRLQRFLRLVAKPVGDRPQPWQTRLQSSSVWLEKPLEGTVRAHYELRGPRDAPQGRLMVDARGLGVPGPRGRRPLPDILTTIDLGRPVSRPQAEAPRDTVLVDGCVGLGAGRARTLALRVQAGQLALAPYEPWHGRLARLRGEVRTLRAQVVGSLDAPRLLVDRLELGEFGVGDVALARVSLGRAAWSAGRLDLGEVIIGQGSLLATVHDSSLPLVAAGGRPAIARDQPLRLTALLQVDDVAEFADLLGSVGAVEGRGKLELNVEGTLASPKLDESSLVVELPQLQLVDRKAGPQAVEVDPATGRPLVAGLDRGNEVALFRDTRVWLKVVENRLRVMDFDGTVMPPPLPPAELARRGLVPGRFAIDRGGTILLRHLDRQRLLANPANLRFSAEHVDGQWKSLALADLSVEGGVSSDDGRRPNRLEVRRCRAWLNDGLVGLGGQVTVRNGDPRRWADNEFRLVGGTPAVAADAVPPLPGSRPRGAPEWVLAVTGQKPAASGAPLVVYPVTLSDRAAGQTRLVAAVALSGTPGAEALPVLRGRVDLLETELREGAVSLAGGGKDKPRTGARWPTAPRLDVLVTAQQANTLFTRVPEINLPWKAALRLSETPQRMRLDGEVDVGLGQVYASVLNSRLTVQNGRAQVRVQRDPASGVLESYSTFTAQAETVIRQARVGRETARETGRESDSYQVSLRIRGSTRPGTDKPVETEVVLEARSDPPLPEEEIFARLSNRSDFALALQKGSLQSLLKEELANAALQTALVYTFAPLFEELRRAVGLDELTVRYELNRPLEMRVGKYLVRGLFLGANVTVTERGESRQVWRVRYDIAGGARTGLEVDSRGEYRVTVEHQRRFR